MLYYRTHASRVGERPPELLGWSSPFAGAVLTDQVVGEHRILAITPPMVFAPPDAGWLPLCAGWEVSSAGAFDPRACMNTSSAWPCRVFTLGDDRWLLPRVLTSTGTRAFRVTYAGDGFKPSLTKQQEAALALAQEIRACHESGTWPDESVRATWAADLLPLTYALSRRSLALIGIHEDLVAATLATAGGFDASSGG